MPRKRLKDRLPPNAIEMARGVSEKSISEAREVARAFGLPISDGESKVKIVSRILDAVGQEAPIKIYNRDRFRWPGRKRNEWPGKSGPKKSQPTKERVAKLWKDMTVIIRRRKFTLPKFKRSKCLSRSTDKRKS